MSSPKLLIICPARDLAEIAALLLEGDYHSFEHQDGGQDVAAYARALDPDVAVVYANLEQGDARQICAELRGQSAVLKLILVGDPNGPVKSALDAADFSIDRFVTRPLAAKTLLFAVRTCVEAARRARSSPSDAAAAQQTEHKVSVVVDRAIDDFVRTAMDSLPPAPYPPAPPSPAPPPAPPPERRRRRARSTVISVPPPPNARSAQAEDTSQAETGDVSIAAPPIELANEPRPEQPSTSQPPERKPLGSVQPSLGDRPPPRPRGGAFARELRRKMTDMAARLFPSGEGKPAVDLAVSHSHDEEIDLSAFGVDTVVEVEHDSAALDQLHGTSTVAKESKARPSTQDGERAGGAPELEPDFVAAPLELSARAPSARAPSAPLYDTVLTRESAGITDIGLFTGLSGDLPGEGEVRRGESDAATIIEYTHRQRFTGKVVFQREDVIKEIYFDKGRPVFAASNLEHDRMGEQLFREGKITAEQYEQVREQVADSGRRMGEVLIELGWLKRRELLPVVRKHIEDIVYSIFAWDSGSYRMLPGDHAGAERIRISRHPAAMILEGVRRKLDQDSLIVLIGAPESIIEIVDDRKLKSVMSVADLSSSERRALTSFDGMRSLGEVHKIAAIELVEVYQLAYGLVVWGAAQSRRRGLDSHAALVDEPALIGETDLAIDRGRVAAKYALVMEADYFALLGVRRDATSFEVKRAYEAARRDYQGESFPAEIRGQLSEQIAEINEVLQEAYLVLRDDALRASYLANLRD